MSALLVTGANGFVGAAVCRHALAKGLAVRAAVRATDMAVPAEAQTVLVGAMDAQTVWTQALQGCHAVVHTAARVHVMNESAADPLSEFRRVNVEGTLNLARQAAAAGVRRFVFVSSVKVHGEGTSAQHAYTASDAPAPQDAYGISKAEAEQGLREVVRESGMDLTVVRPPLVYGPGVKANFRSLMRAVDRGLPLPLGSVTGNRRSLVALDNLADLLLTCAGHPAAAGQAFLVSDGEDLSTAELLRRMGRALSRPARLWPCPPALLRLAAGGLGRASVAQRLLGSLRVDIAHTTAVLGWTPPISVDEGLRRAAAGLGSR